MRKRIPCAILSVVLVCALLVGCSGEASSNSQAASNAASSSNSSSAESVPSSSSSAESESEATSDSASSSEAPDVVKDQMPIVTCTGVRSVSMTKDNMLQEVYTCFQIKNPNEKQTVRSLCLELTFYDANGSTVKTETMVLLPTIAAKDTVWVSHSTNVWGDRSKEKNERVTRVSYKLNSVVSNAVFVDQEEVQTPSSSELVVSNLSRPNGANKITGTVTNKGKRKVTVILSSVYKCGSTMEAGNSAAVNYLAPGESMAFEIDASNEPEKYDSYGVYPQVNALW